MKLFSQERGQGFPVLILHGLFGLSDNWMSVANQLAERHRVVLADLRNHGRSPHEEDMGLDVMAADVLELMDDLFLEKPVLLGHSLGGKVAMNLALKFPQRVHALIVVDIGPGAYSPRHLEIIKALEAVPLDRISRRQEADNVLSSYGLPEPIRQFLLKSLARDSSGKFQWRFNLQSIKSNLPRLSEAAPEHLTYQGPTLFVKGERSDYLTDADGALIASLFPRASLAVIPGAGHWVHADNPGAFLQVVSRFLLSV
ncbi:MAG: alpha/beta fold hydrolase [Flavobacteriales bacterium]|nr:alpha/beta fold hydrolase [Flavobacteriales bacterium]